MNRFFSLLPLSFVLASASVFAQDGEQLYGLYCGACHGADGKGATGGAFPQLAGSEWLHGNPKRSIAIVLKGLHGPVEVAGKSYNLEMPPQEDALSVANIVAILNYVHKAWGNRGQEVKNDMVNVSKAEYAARKEPWTAAELLKLYPLEKKVTFLDNLTSQVYKGDWQTMPDFSKLKAENVEEEHSGVLDVRLAELTEKYAIVWEGDFKSPKNGMIEFNLVADDAARVIFEQKTVCEVKGIGPAEDSRGSRGKVKLKAGSNPIRVEYMQNAGLQSIQLAFRAVGTKPWTWVSADRPVGKEAPDPIVLAPVDGKPVIYRNFIKGVSARAIGFGFPGEVNLAYSADNLAPELAWAGEFMDAGRHWTGRGNGFQEPMAKSPHALTNAKIYPPAARFRGYTLDKAGNPTFHISVGAVKIMDAFKPGAGKTLVRTLTMTGATTAMEIPLGNGAVTGSKQSISLRPNILTEVIYKLD